ncbi:MAG: DUF424 family protein [Candidatus Hodarchaeaceae archaeon]|nr:DUF424 family protein [Candidatus Hodarchaeaceae archaeon]
MPRLRVVRTAKEVLVIICDGELIGKEFRQGELKLKIDKSFYGGKEASVEECLAALREATIANMIGSIVERAIEEGFVDRENVIQIRNVPHAQMVRM